MGCKHVYIYHLRALSRSLSLALISLFLVFPLSRKRHHQRVCLCRNTRRSYGSSRRSSKHSSSSAALRTAWCATHPTFLFCSLAHTRIHSLFLFSLVSRSGSIHTHTHTLARVLALTIPLSFRLSLLQESLYSHIVPLYFLTFFSLFLKLLHLFLHAHFRY